MDDIVYDVQDWARATLGFGAAGATYGVLSGFLNGQPMSFFAAAYGVNALLISGSALGLRAIALRALPAQYTDDKRWVTGGATGLVGGATAGYMFGRGRIPVAAASWAVAGWAGQHGLDSVNDWRAAQAAKLRQAEEQGQGGPAAGRSGAQQGMAGASAPAHAAGAAAAASAAAPPRPAGQRADTAAAAQSAPAPPLATSPALPAAIDLRPAAGAAAPTHQPSDTSSSILGPETPWGWLPFAIDSATADARRLRKVKARLADVEDALGLTPPQARHDPRLAEVLELERNAGIRQ